MYNYLGIVMNSATTETPTIRGKTGAGVKSCRNGRKGRSTEERKEDKVIANTG